MMFWHGGALMWTGMSVFVALLIVIVFLFVMGGLRPPGVGLPRDTPRQILDGRVARGEIDSDEYGRLLDAITVGDAGGAGVAGAQR